LIKALHLKRVRLVGAGMGAAAALTLALDKPRMVRSLVIAEPPLLAMAREFPDGGALYRDYVARIDDRARAAFAAGDEVGAMRFIVDGLASSGRFDRLAPDARMTVMQNAKFFRMMARSEIPYPDIPRHELRDLKFRSSSSPARRPSRSIDASTRSSPESFRALGRPPFQMPVTDRRAKIRWCLPRSC
jgi:pimeloyl-ACP methyl ester carboxylesterase